MVFPENMINRFWSKVEKTDGCWFFLGALDEEGYGKFAITPRKTGRAHRVAWQIDRGRKIKPGFTVDHVCHNKDVTCRLGSKCPHRKCVNPAHLRTVKIGKNILDARKRLTTCKKGHPYSGNNLVIRNGKRRCLTCERTACLARYHRRREAA